MCQINKIVLRGFKICFINGLLKKRPTKATADLLDEGISMSFQQNFLVTQLKNNFCSIVL